MARKKEEPVDFERALGELEALVERMEQGEMTLEESLRSFERGMSLTRQCQKALDEAQQKVDKLLEEDGETRVTPFEGQQSDNAGESRSPGDDA